MSRIIAKLSLCNFSQYPQNKVQKLFFIFYSHVIWKFDVLCSCGVLLPFPMLRSKSANCKFSPRSFDLMFCVIVSCNLVTVCQRYEDFSVASTISGLDPRRTTGKIYRQTPAKSTAGPPNGNDFFRMSCIVLSIDSNTCLCPIENSRNLRIQ